MRFIAPFLLFLFVVPTAAYCADDEAAKSDSESGLMTILGVGEYSAKPEVVMIQANLESRGVSKDEVQRANVERMQKAKSELNALTALGLSIAEGNYYLRDFRPAPQANASPSHEPAKVEWVARNSFSLKLIQVENTEKAMDALARAGFGIDNIHFGFADERGALRMASKAAVKDAMDQAHAYADATGVNLGEIKSISDGDVRGSSAADLPYMKGSWFDIPEKIRSSATVEIKWRIFTQRP